MEKGQEKLKRNLSEKVMLPKNSKKGNNAGHDDRNIKKNRFLVTVNVLGSAGPIRFVANEDDPVSTIIQTSLKNYAREGRLPVLGTDINSFVLHGIAQSDGMTKLAPIAIEISTNSLAGCFNLSLTCVMGMVFCLAIGGFQVLNPNETIGSVAGRSFVLCKKQMNPQMTEARSEMVTQKVGRNWKAWLNKSFSFKVLSN